MTRTTEKRKYLYRQTKGDRVYVYFRHPRTKQLTALPDDETSQAFADAYDPLLAAVAAKPDKTPRTPDQLGRWKNPRDYTIDPKIVFRPGSIGWFIDRYKQSAKWRALSDGTRYNYASRLIYSKRNLGPRCSMT
jgi:hypothetical protein